MGEDRPAYASDETCLVVEGFPCPDDLVPGGLQCDQTHLGVLVLLFGLLDDPPGARIEGEELREQVRQSLARLPSEQAEAFWLRHIEQLSPSEIAELMERTELVLNGRFATVTNAGAIAL